MAKNNNVDLYEKIHDLIKKEFKKYVTQADRPHDSYLFIGSALKDGELTGGEVLAGSYGSRRNISFLLVSASNSNLELREAIKAAAKLIEEKEERAAEEEYEREAKARGEAPCDVCGKYHPKAHDLTDLPDGVRTAAERIRNSLREIIGRNIISGGSFSETRRQIEEQILGTNSNNDNNINNNDDARPTTPGRNQQPLFTRRRPGETFGQFLRRVSEESSEDTNRRLSADANSLFPATENDPPAQEGQVPGTDDSVVD